MTNSFNRLGLKIVLLAESGKDVSSSDSPLNLSYYIYAQTKQILSLDIGLLIAGAKERGELEARVTELLKEIKKSGKNISEFSLEEKRWAKAILFV